MRVVWWEVGTGVKDEVGVEGGGGGNVYEVVMG